MAKNGSTRSTQKEPAAKRSFDSGLDILRLATFAGVAAVLILSFWIWRSLDRNQDSLERRLAQIENRLAQVSSKVETAAAQNQPVRRGPDPNRVYTINTAIAPVKGPVSAPVTVAEFSDFQ